MSRDYKREYASYHSKPEQKINRAKRNLWNRRLKGKVPSGMEIDHKNPLARGGGNGRANIRYRSVSANRADKSSLYKQAMWEGFVDELTKTAEFDKLSELEKEAFLKHLKKGMNFVNDKANEAFIRGSYKVGMDPLEAVQRANSAISAASAVGATPGSTGAMVAAAGAKNLAGGKALSAISKRFKKTKLQKATKGMENVYQENYGKISDSMLGNKAFDATTYNMGRQSVEGFTDRMLDLGGQVTRSIGNAI